MPGDDRHIREARTADCIKPIFGALDLVCSHYGPGAAAY
jgi:hypothetical protein